MKIKISCKNCAHHFTGHCMAGTNEKNPAFYLIHSEKEVLKKPAAGFCLDWQLDKSYFKRAVLSKSEL